MLNNHLISTLKILSLGYLLTACSNPKQMIKEVDKKVNCHMPSSSIGERHVAISMASKFKNLKSCINNYLKFEINKHQTLDFCVYTHISKRGGVKKAKVYAYASGKDFKRGLGMCFEQEIWHMNFKNLHLNKSIRINFPVRILTQ